MSRLMKRHGPRHTAVPIKILRNPALSLEARGMIAMMMTAGEDIPHETIALQELSRLGRARFRAVMHELEQAGYVAWPGDRATLNDAAVEEVAQA